MSLARLMVHDLTVVHAATTDDEYGTPQKNWTTATRTNVKGWITQLRGDEVTPDRETQTADWLAYLPADTAVSGFDRIEWSSVAYEVDGPPLVAWTPRGEHHIEARLRVSDAVVVVAGHYVLESGAGNYLTEAGDVLTMEA